MLRHIFTCPNRRTRRRPKKWIRRLYRRRVRYTSRRMQQVSQFLNVQDSIRSDDGRLVAALSHNVIFEYLDEATTSRQEFDTVEQARIEWVATMYPDTLPDRYTSGVQFEWPAKRAKGC